MDAKVKITVVEKLQHKPLLEKYADSVWEPCERLSEGEEFVSEHANMPDGFCSWAWADIQKYVLTLARGGNFRGSEARYIRYLLYRRFPAGDLQAGKNMRRMS